MYINLLRHTHNIRHMCTYIQNTYISYPYVYIVCVYIYAYILHILHSNNISLILILRQIEIIYSSEKNFLVCWTYHYKYEKLPLLLLWGKNTCTVNAQSVIFISLLLVEKIISSRQAWTDTRFPAWGEEPLPNPGVQRLCAFGTPPASREMGVLHPEAQSSALAHERLGPVSTRHFSSLRDML